MDLRLVIGLLMFGHCIGDFVCQSRWMADNKSKRWDALLLHVSTVTVVLLVTAALILGVSIGQACGCNDRAMSSTQVWSFVLYALVNGVAHFVQDAVTSRMTSSLYKEGRIHGFFAVIGLDQFLHLATYLVSLPILGVV